MNQEIPANPKPIICQSDKSILLEVHSEAFAEARNFLAKFAELEKSPEHIHTYQATPISVWNAASAGVSYEEIEAGFKKFSKFTPPESLLREIRNAIRRFGVVQFHPAPSLKDSFILKVQDEDVLSELFSRPSLAKLLIQPVGHAQFALSIGLRGALKQQLIEIGLPVEDLIGFTTGDPLPMALRSQTSDGRDFHIRKYQADGAETFYLDGHPAGGQGVVVLPCGAGKTIVGLKAMSLIQAHTLIICPNAASVHQWIREILDKTDIRPEEIGEYSSAKKEIRPITVATYQIIIYRSRIDQSFPHFDLFLNYRWGLIIYDEVHLLPAPIFRVTSQIQATRRLGLTATLIREDGKEREVFSLIGPKRFDVPWRELETKGFIASAQCHELRVPMPGLRRIQYISGNNRTRFRMASENVLKEILVAYLLEKHSQEPTLIIGQYLSQLKSLAKRFRLPIITGQMKNELREEYYDQFRRNELRILIVSKVANFAIDLPDASVAIQISGTFGSRQEEAQRLGRILRPKDRPAQFYSIITKDTIDEDYALNRRRFLTEQGYDYRMEEWTEEDLLEISQGLKYSFADLEQPISAA